MHVPLVELEELLLELDELELLDDELELEELLLDVVPEPEEEEPDPPPHPASKAVAPTPPIQASARRRSINWRDIVSRSKASPRS
jgi:hypothetical protein